MLKCINIEMYTMEIYWKLYLLYMELYYKYEGV